MAVVWWSGGREGAKKGERMYESPTFEQLTGSTLGAYRLEQFLEQSELGPVFLGRSTATGAAYRLRLLAISPELTSEERSAYLARFERQTQHVATLQHPYILPLVDYGYGRDTPYLVSPHLPTRSLTARLAQNGPFDVLKAGRYLDQIAAALEYAHEHATLHRNLTTDIVYLQLDGQIVVADFGTRRMIELSESSHPRIPLYYSDEACAPEQLLDRPVERPADIYALGALLYRMLTGSPVFTGATREEVARQHLYASPPTLAARRPGLPASLDAIIGMAMAKDPAQRFSQPGALANAYHQIISPNNATRVPFVISAQPSASPRAPDSLVTPPPVTPSMSIERVGASDDSSALTSERGAGPLHEPTSGPQPLRPISTVERKQSTWRRIASWRIAVIGAVLVALVAGGVFVLHGSTSATTAIQATGEASFMDSQSGQPGHSDAVAITISSLGAPPSGSVYDAWMLNTQAEQVIGLGTLRQTHNGFTLTYKGNGSATTPGINLLGAGNMLEITQEHGSVTVPVGEVLLAGEFPPQAFVHVQHLLVAFPATPGKIGLLEGLLQQAQLLHVQAQALQRAIANQDVTATQCEAQSIINILEGAHGANYQPIAGICAAQNPTAAGDGFGLLGSRGSSGGYITDASEHASLAATQPDATNTLRTHAQLVVTVLTNVKSWATTLDQEAASFLKNPADPGKAQQVMLLADHIYAGFDANHDGKIAPVAGEGGVLMAYQQAQMMASLKLIVKQ